MPTTLNLRPFLRSVAICVSVAWAGVAWTADAVPAAPTAPATGAVLVAAVPGQAQPLGTEPPEYRLAAGDVVRIVVYQNPDLSLEARLSEAGALNFPLLGSLRLGGLTVAAAEQVIARGLREGQFVRQPQVNVSVIQVRGHQASVLGLVNRPGRFARTPANGRFCPDHITH